MIKINEIQGPFHVSHPLLYDFEKCGLFICINKQYPQGNYVSVSTFQSPQSFKLERLDSHTFPICSFKYKATSLKWMPSDEGDKAYEMSHWMFAIAITDPAINLVIFDAKDKNPIRGFRNLNLDSDDIFKRLYFSDKFLTALSAKG